MPPRSSGEYKATTEWAAQFQNDIYRIIQALLDEHAENVHRGGEAHAAVDRARAGVAELMEIGRRWQLRPRVPAPGPEANSGRPVPRKPLKRPAVELGTDLSGAAAASSSWERGPLDWELV